MCIRDRCLPLSFPSSLSLFVPSHLALSPSPRFDQTPDCLALLSILVQWLFWQWQCHELYAPPPLSSSRAPHPLHLLKIQFSFLNKTLTLNSINQSEEEGSEWGGAFVDDVVYSSVWFVLSSFPRWSFSVILSYSLCVQSSWGWWRPSEESDISMHLHLVIELRPGGCKAWLSATVHRHLSLPNIFTATAIAFTDPLTTTTVHHRHPLAHTRLTGGTLTTLILACEFTSGQPAKIATMDTDLESLLDKYIHRARWCHCNVFRDRYTSRTTWISVTVLTFLSLFVFVFCFCFLFNFFCCCFVFVFWFACLLVLFCCLD